MWYKEKYERCMQVFLGKHERRPRSRREDNIKMDLKIGWECVV
jgi:hypothetical protein